MDSSITIFVRKRNLKWSDKFHIQCCKLVHTDWYHIWPGEHEPNLNKFMHLAPDRTFPVRGQRGRPVSICSDQQASLTPVVYIVFRIGRLECSVRHSCMGWTPISSSTTLFTFLKLALAESSMLQALGRAEWHHNVAVWNSVTRGTHRASLQ